MVQQLSGRDDLSGLLTRKEEWSKPFLLMLGVICIILLACLDYVTGYELAFPVFYVVPLSLLSWSSGWTAGIFASGLSTIAWHLANRMAGETYSHPAIPYWNTLARLSLFLLTCFLIAKLREALDREIELARIDPLTGVANRRFFHELAEREIARARRTGTALSVAYIDVDNFKVVNDTLGHHTGDLLLRTIAGTLQKSVRAVDLVARVGGDEFAVLLPDTDSDAGRVVTSKLNEAVLQQTEEHNWPVTLSIGAITCVTPPHSVDQLIHQADMLMYEAKEGGKNAVRHQLLQQQEPAPETAPLGDPGDSV